MTAVTVLAMPTHSINAKSLLSLRNENYSNIAFKNFTPTLFFIYHSVCMYHRY